MGYAIRNDGNGWRSVDSLLDVAPNELWSPVVPPHGNATLVTKKGERADAVAQLKVTTQAGHTYDADLDSQTKMGVYLAALNADDIIPWVMADNSIAMIDRVELREALRLAGTAMANLWIQPYV